MRCRPSSSWHLFLLLHAPKQFQRMNTLETITEEPNEAISAQTKSEHRCKLLKSTQFVESIHKLDDKTENESIDNEKETNEKESSSESRERSRKQWETSPDQMKEISRSLSELNGSHIEKSDKQLIRSKRSKSKENLSEKQTTRPTLPPLNSLSDSDSGKELNQKCICEDMYKSNGELQSPDGTETNQWVVSRPIRNKPKDNLILEGLMELETTFNTTYDSTAKQINENLSKSVAVVMPSKQSLDGSNFENLKESNINGLNVIKSSKKKAKHRPSTSLKAGGDGYFNTISKESYKNFVIIDNKNKTEKTICGSNGKKTSVCCSAVSNIKLPKVDSIHREDQQNHKKLNKREDRDSHIEQINKSMQRLTTSDKNEMKNVSQNTQTNGISYFVDSSVQTNDINSRNEKKSNEKISFMTHKETEHQMNDNVEETTQSWTVGALEEHKRVYTRDVDSIKELGLLDKSDEQIVREIQRIAEKDKQNKVLNESKLEAMEGMRNRTRLRNESKNYVQHQRRQKKYKNESSMKLFDGDMDFMTTTRTYFADKSPNRSESTPRLREKTAGKKSRKSGRRRNLFRTSSEAEFCEPYRQNLPETTYRKQFGDRLYCPAIDLGSNKSDFKYKGESSGHKFFLPSVNN